MKAIQIITRMFHLFPLRSIVWLLIAAGALTCESGCKKLTDAGPPVSSVTSASVFNSNATAAAVLTGIYANLSNTGSYGGAGYGFTTLSAYAGLSADELTLFDQSDPYNVVFYTNSLSANTDGYEYWSNIYNYIFACNSAIEGLNSSTSLGPAVKQQLLGEAKFMRAFCYFYLVNLYGDVPLALSSNYKINSVIARSPGALVYQQIIADLKDAQSRLSDHYLDASLLNATTERVRPTRWAATAMLARAYLYTGDWANAEAQAGAVINNTSLYGLTTLDNTFLSNSTEAIWQLQPVTTDITNTQDAYFFIIPATGPDSFWNVYLSNSLLNSFESGDQRKTNWTDTITANGTLYSFAYKYKVNTSGAPVTEYEMVLRLAEQYLIRAEAEAQLGESGAVTDLNTIRNRAGLPGYGGATDKASLLSAILHERQVELFTEWGHRWLDLKRTGNADAVMSVVTPLKGGTWSSGAQLYPLPLFDLQRNPNLKQNPGY